MSSQLKLNLTLVAVLTGIFSGLLYVLYIEDREHLRAELSARAAAIGTTAERLLVSPGALSDVSTQQALCESLAEIEDVLWVELFDREGKVVAHSIAERIGQQADRMALRMTTVTTHPAIVAPASIEEQEFSAVTG